MTEENPNETYCDKILAKTMDYCIFQEAPSLCQTLLLHYRKSCLTIHKPTVNSLPADSTGQDSERQM